MICKAGLTFSLVGSGWVSIGSDTSGRIGVYVGGIDVGLSVGGMLVSVALSASVPVGLAAKASLDLPAWEPVPLHAEIAKHSNNIG